MAIELPNNWTTFSGGDGASCALSTPSINASGEMDCEAGASVTLTVTGGIGPYDWTTTKGVITGSPGTSVTLTPPANPYTGAAGTVAYSIGTKIIDVFCACRTSIWDCYGTKFQTCLGINACWTGSCVCGNCAGAADAVCDISCTPSCACGKPACAGSGCPEANSHHFCINGTGNCQPCAISMNGGAVVTVTDSLGQSAFVTVSTSPRSTL
jgi:hypothetical protein